MTPDRPAPPARWDGTWESLPPKRRRFFLWAFLWATLLDTLLRVLLEFAGVPDVAAGILTIAGALVFLAPLGRSAWQELIQRRSRGEEPPPRPMTGRRLAAWTGLTVLSWLAFTALLIWQMRPLFPALPLFLSGITVFGFRRRRREQASRGASPRAGGTGSEAGDR